jgi:hypothetical protein
MQGRKMQVQGFLATSMGHLRITSPLFLLMGAACPVVKWVLEMPVLGL